MRKELERLRARDISAAGEGHDPPRRRHPRVRKGDIGEVEGIKQGDLSSEQAQALGAYAGALIGLGMGDDDAITAGAEIGTAAGEDRHLDRRRSGLVLSPV